MGMRKDYCEDIKAAYKTRRRSILLMSRVIASLLTHRVLTRLTGVGNDWGCYRRSQDDRSLFNEKDGPCGVWKAYAGRLGWRTLASLCGARGLSCRRTRSCVLRTAS